MKNLTAEKCETCVPIGNEIVAKWLESVDAKKRTLRTYTKNIGYFLRYLQDNGISHPTKKTLREYRDNLKKDHKPTTVKAYLKPVQFFFKWTNSEGLYPDIAQNVKLPQLTNDFKKDYLTAEQMQKLLKSINRSTIEGKRDYAMILLMGTTGLRTISIGNANIGDIGKVAGEDVLFYLNKGSEDKTHYVKLTKPVLNALSSYLKRRGPKSPEMPLFASLSKRNKGSRMTERSVSRICKERLKKADFDDPRLTAHSFRHTAATLNIIAGGSVEETRQLLAHSSPGTTLVYCHTIQRADNRSEQRITDEIFKKRKKTGK